MNSSENHRFIGKRLQLTIGNTSYLIRFNSHNIRSKIWRQPFTWKLPVNWKRSMEYRIHSFVTWKLMVSRTEIHGSTLRKKTAFPQNSEIPARRFIRVFHTEELRSRFRVAVFWARCLHKTLVLKKGAEELTAAEYEFIIPEAAIVSMMVQQ